MPAFVRPIAADDGYEPIVALYADEEGDVRFDLAQATRRRLEAVGFVDSGFYVAEAEGRVVGAASVACSPGKLASVRPPVWLEGAGDDVRAALFARLDAALGAAGTRVAFASLPRTEDSSDDSPRRFLFDGRPWRRTSAIELPSHGFLDRVELDVMTCDVGGEIWDAEPDDSRLNWMNAESIGRPAHERLVAATYEGSLDCPALNGRRDVADVLAGYRGQGSWEPSFWQVASIGGEAVGCLFLSDWPDADSAELLYFGVIPQRRGAGLGLSIVRHALAFARDRGRSWLVLSIDRENRPAGEIYRFLGFSIVDRRDVFLKFS